MGNAEMENKKRRKWENMSTDLSRDYFTINQTNAMQGQCITQLSNCQSSENCTLYQYVLQTPFIFLHFHIQPDQQVKNPEVQKNIASTKQSQKSDSLLADYQVPQVLCLLLQAIFGKIFVVMNVNTTECLFRFSLIEKKTAFILLTLIRYYMNMQEPKGQVV